MKYAYEDLSDAQFERLVILICQQILGISVQGFAKGIDGGRDAKFVGTAQLHPSTASPWVGTTIIQAKHTNGFNRLFSETDFYNKKSDKTVIGDEIPRIKKLVVGGQLDHYMLFSNRRLGGNTESEIRKHIAERCDLQEESIYLCDVEQLELWMKRFPAVAELADLDPIDSPLIFSPEELSEIVQAFALNKEEVASTIDDPPTSRTSYDRKNELNDMGAEYARAQKKKFLKETPVIKRFLDAPENMEILRLYESVTDELELKIISKRKDYQSFDEVMEYLVDLLHKRDPILRQRGNKRLTRALLFYMYWNCDIGEDDAETDQTFTS